MSIACGAFYDDEDRGYSCQLEPGHGPPHREIQDYRTESGGGYLLTFEWWNDWGNDRASGKRWEG